MSDSITLHIKGPSELKLDIEIATDKTVLELKEAIAAKSDVEKERQRLIYSGKVLKDEETLATYKLQAGHTVHMVKGAPKTGDASGSSSSAASAFGAASASQQRIPTMAAGQGRDPLAALEGVQGHGMGGGTFNPFADMGLGNLADPNAMTGMMNTPQFQQQMASMLQNPEVLDQIIASNPQLSAMGPQIRQMMQSEQFRNFLTNPESMRQMAAMRGMMGGAGGQAAFPPPGAFGAAPPAGDAGAAAAAPAAGNPFDMFGGGGGGGGAAAGGAPGGGLFGNMPMPTPEQMAQMQAMMGGAGAGGFGGFGGPPAPPADARPAHERYADQLAQLQGMGFYDGQKNLEALQIAGGNVSAAVEYLFSHP